MKFFTICLIVLSSLIVEIGAVDHVNKGDTQVPAPSEELSRYLSDYSSDSDSSSSSDSDSTKSELKKMKRDRALDKYARLAEKQPTTSGPTSTGYDMAITTVFTPPPECSGGITEVATMTGVLWQNIIDPVPNVTLTSCYPSQFVASALATTSLPPFSELVCPDTWESYDVNSTYVICCPK